MNTIIQQARNEIALENNTKAKDALKIKLRELHSAKAVVANIQRQVDDLEASITDGSFVRHRILRHSSNTWWYQAASQ